MTKSTRNTRVNRTATAIAAVAIGVLFTACRADSVTNNITSRAVELGSTSTAAAATDGQLASAAGASDNYSLSSTRAIVVVDSELTLLNEPGGFPIGTLSATTEYGTRRVMLAEATNGDWIRVRLPVRPNHTSAWVSAETVKLEHVEFRVDIELAARTLTVQVGGAVFVTSEVAIGGSENPTPVGTFYITDKLETPDPGGAYGPYALELSGFSETGNEFAGGNRRIGIHGTNDPESIGRAVSHGSIRLPNDVVILLARALPLGTPVHIA